MRIQASDQSTKYWHYHHEHGHYTKECYDLKQQIEILVGQGKLQWIGATQQDGRPILHKKRRLLDDNHPTRETWWAEATSPLEYQIPEEYLLYLQFKKKRKKVNDQYRLPFYNISEVVLIIQVAKVTNNLRDDQLK